MGEQIQLTDPPEITETGNVVEFDSGQEINQNIFYDSNFYSGAVPYPYYSTDNINSYVNPDYRNINIIEDDEIINQPFYTNEYFSGERIFTGINEFSQQPKEFDGYIIQFEKEPVVVAKTTLTKKFSESLELTGRATDSAQSRKVLFRT